jgi:hypothetical protein
MNFMELDLWIAACPPYFAALRHNFRFPEAGKRA